MVTDSSAFNNKQPLCLGTLLPASLKCSTSSVAVSVLHYQQWVATQRTHRQAHLPLIHKRELPCLTPSCLALNSGRALGTSRHAVLPHDSTRKNAPRYAGTSCGTEAMPEATTTGSQRSQSCGWCAKLPTRSL